MPTRISSWIPLALSLLLTCLLFAPLATYAQTCDYDYRDERDYVIAALIIPLSASFFLLLYNAARTVASWSRTQSLWFALGGLVLAAIVSLGVVANTDFYADCYS